MCIRDRPRKEWEKHGRVEFLSPKRQRETHRTRVGACQIVRLVNKAISAIVPPLNMARQRIPVEDSSNSAHGCCVVADVVGEVSFGTFGSMVIFSPRQSSNRPSTSRDGFPLPDSMLLSVWTAISAKSARSFCRMPRVCLRFRSRSETTAAKFRESMFILVNNTRTNRRSNEELWSFFHFNEPDCRISAGL